VLQDFRDKAVLNSMELDTAMAVMQCYENKQKRDGKGGIVFGKDNPIATKSWRTEDDNCADKLHSLRYSLIG